jgi:hypothetical protein
MMMMMIVIGKIKNRREKLGKKEEMIVSGALHNTSNARGRYPV